MYPMISLLMQAAELSIPDRPATWSEALKLMGIGWGSIFIVIAIIILVVVVLNAATKKK